MNVKVRMKISITLLIMSILWVSTTCYAANGDSILGVWNDEEKDAKIEIYTCGEKYCGKIISAKEPNYPPGSREGTPGTPRLDAKNPDAVKRSNPIIGLQIMNDFVFAGEGVWKDGAVYDPKSGNTYHGKMILVSPNKLVMRGFVGIPLFGRSTTWTRENIK
jgi:uncharacterized protein (DUF2147 family)